MQISFPDTPVLQTQLNAKVWKSKTFLDIRIYEKYTTVMKFCTNCINAYCSLYRCLEKPGLYYVLNKIMLTVILTTSHLVCICVCMFTFVRILLIIVIKIRSVESAVWRWIGHLYYGAWNIWIFLRFSRSHSVLVKRNSPQMILVASSKT